MSTKPLLCIASSITIGLISACSATNDTTRFYTLQSAETQVVSKYEITDGLSISIESLIVPRLIDRPQIISRIGNNEINRSEFHQWGGSVVEEITQLLTDTLEHEFTDSSYFILRSDSRIQPKYRLYIEIKRLDGSLGKEAHVELTWLLESPETELSLHGLVQHRETIIDHNYTNYVSALRTLILKSTQSLAQQLREALEPR